MNRRFGLAICVGIGLLAALSGQCAADEAEMRIARTRSPVMPTLTRAYEALMAGEFLAAETAYAEVLAEDARNTDAIHGLAAIGIVRGDAARTEAYYRRALWLDATDAIAVAGLHGLAGDVGAAQTESRFKTLLAAQPDHHILRFALGNVYAARGQWHEARREYQLAHAGDPGQPDYLFNIAVALDHLAKTDLAQRYYRMAQSAAESRPAVFIARERAMARRGERTSP